MHSCRPWGSWMSISAIAGSRGRPAVLERVQRRAAQSGAAVGPALLLGLLLSAAATVARAEPAASGNTETAKSVLKPIDVFDLQWAADPQISPDGRNIAYVRMRMDVKTDRPRGTIWLTGIDGKHTRPLSGAADSSMPRWSPDGTRIAFLAAA